MSHLHTVWMSFFAWCSWCGKKQTLIITSKDGGGEGNGATVLASSSQATEREQEMVTLMNKEKIQENGNTEEFTVITLEESPDKDQLAWGRWGVAKSRAGRRSWGRDEFEERVWWLDGWGQEAGLQTAQVKTALVASTVWTLGKGVCVWCQRLSYWGLWAGRAPLNHVCQLSEDMCHGEGFCVWGQCPHIWWDDGLITVGSWRQNGKWWINSETWVILFKIQTEKQHKLNNPR